MGNADGFSLKVATLLLAWIGSASHVASGTDTTASETHATAGNATAATESTAQVTDAAAARNLLDQSTSAIFIWPEVVNVNQNETAIVRCWLNETWLAGELQFSTSCSACQFQSRILWSPAHPLQQEIVMTLTATMDWNGTYVTCQHPQSLDNAAVHTSAAGAVRSFVFVTATASSNISLSGGSPYLENSTAEVVCTSTAWKAAAATAASVGAPVNPPPVLDIRIDCRACSMSLTPAGADLGAIAMTFVATMQWYDVLATCVDLDHPSSTASYRIRVAKMPQLIIVPQNATNMTSTNAILRCLSVGGDGSPLDLQWYWTCPDCRGVSEIEPIGGWDATLYLNISVYWNNTIVTCMSVRYPSLSIQWTVRLAALPEVDNSSYSAASTVATAKTMAMSLTGLSSFESPTGETTASSVISWSRDGSTAAQAEAGPSYKTAGVVTPGPTRATAGDSKASSWPTTPSSFVTTEVPSEALSQSALARTHAPTPGGQAQPSDAATGFSRSASAATATATVTAATTATTTLAAAAAATTTMTPQPTSGMAPGTTIVPTSAAKSETVAAITTAATKTMPTAASTAAPGERAVVMWPETVYANENESVIVRCWSNEVSLTADALRISSSCSDCVPVRAAVEILPAMPDRLGRTLVFVATMKWNSTTLICRPTTPGLAVSSSISEARSSVIVTAAGTGRVQLSGDSPYLEGEVSHVTCWAAAWPTADGAASAAVQPPPLLEIRTNCGSACAVLPQAAGEDTASVTMSFTASAAWNDVLATCVDLNDTSSEASYRIKVARRPRLLISPLEATFFGPVTGILRCQSFDGDADGSPLDLRWSISCPYCRPIESSSVIGGWAISFKFSASAIWDDAVVTCASARYPSLRVRQAMRIYDEPTLSLSMESEVTWRGAMQSIRCAAMPRGRLPKNFHLTWRTSCVAAGCPYKEVPGAQQVRLLFNGSEKWNNTIVECRASAGYSLSLSMQVVVHALPRLHVRPKKVESYMHERQTLQCSSDSPHAPPSLIRWLPEGGAIFKQQTLQGSTTSDSLASYFVLTASEMWNGRLIACQFTAGVQPLTYVTDDALVRVFDPPLLIIEPERLLFADGDNVSLTCSTDGYAISGLQFDVACLTCDYTEAPGDVEVGWQSSRQLLFVASEEWNDVDVVCSIDGRAWLNKTANVRVRGSMARIVLSYVLLPVCIGVATMGTVIAVIVFCRAATNMHAIRGKSKRKSSSRSRHLHTGRSVGTSRVMPKRSSGSRTAGRTKVSRERTRQKAGRGSGSAASAAGGEKSGTYASRSRPRPKRGRRSPSAVATTGDGRLTIPALAYRKDARNMAGFGATPLEQTFEAAAAVLAAVGLHRAKTMPTTSSAHPPSPPTGVAAAFDSPNSSDDVFITALGSPMHLAPKVSFSFVPPASGCHAVPTMTTNEEADASRLLSGIATTSRTLASTAIATATGTSASRARVSAAELTATNESGASAAAVAASDAVGHRREAREPRLSEGMRERSALGASSRGKGSTAGGGGGSSRHWRRKDASESLRRDEGSGSTESELTTDATAEPLSPRSQQQQQPHSPHLQIGPSEREIAAAARRQKAAASAAKSAAVTAMAIGIGEASSRRRGEPQRTGSPVLSSSSFMTEASGGTPTARASLRNVSALDRARSNPAVGAKVADAETAGASARTEARKQSWQTRTVEKPRRREGEKKRDIKAEVAKEVSAVTGEAGSPSQKSELKKSRTIAVDQAKGSKLMAVAAEESAKIRESSGGREADDTAAHEKMPSMSREISHPEVAPSRKSQGHRRGAEARPSRTGLQRRGQREAESIATKASLSASKKLAPLP